MVRIESILALLGILISLPGIASVFPHVDTVTRMVAIVAVSGAAAGALRGITLRGPLPTLVTVPFFLYYALQFSRTNLIQPAVNLLVLLLCVRLVSEKSPRNYLQLFALSLFVLAGSSLFSLGAAFLFYLVLLLFLIAVALVLVTFFATDRAIALSRVQLRKVLSVALLLPVASIPLMLLFFIIMPRTQYPLWDFLNPGGVSGAAGLSDTVRPGSTPRVAETGAVAFRAALPKLDKSLLYWRGIVFNTFRDNSWIREEPPDRPGAMPAGGKVVQLTLYPEPRPNRYIIALDMPLRIDGVRGRRGPDLVFTAGSPLTRRVRYMASSVPGGTLAVKGGIDRDFYLRLPARLPPRIVSLGRSFRDSPGTVEERLARIEEFYRTGRFRYSTTGLPTGGDALDTFLFEGRTGHCEFFASSLALLLRLADIPCRLVGGYHGGTYNEMGGYYVVTEDMAHVWVEAFIPGKGWVSLDPSSWTAGFDRGGGRDGWLGRARMSADAFSYFWNLAVITYDLEKQINLFTTTSDRIRRISPANSSGSLVYPAVLLFAVIGVALCCRRFRWRTPEERILRQFFAAVAARYGVQRDDPAMGLQEYARLVKSPLVDEFVEVYSRKVFRDERLGSADYRRLRELVAGIRKGGR